MLRQLSSSHDNGQSMVIHLLGMKHAPTVVSSHDNGQSIVIHPEGMNHAPTIDIVT